MRKIALLTLAGATMFSGVAGAATVNAATIPGAPDTVNVGYKEVGYSLPLMNDSLPRGDSWASTRLKDASGREVTTLTTTAGTFTITEDNFMVEFTPNKNFWGKATVTYVGTSEQGSKSESTLTFNVKAPRAAAAVADTATVKSGSSVSMDVLRNDQNPDATFLANTFTLKGDGNATWTDEKTGGDIVVTPRKGFAGTLNGSYTIKDSAGRTFSAPITITVTGAGGTTTPAPKPAPSKPAPKPAPSKTAPAKSSKPAAKPGKVVKKQGKVVKKHGKAVNKHGKVVKKQGKAVNKYGKVVNKYGKARGPMVQTDYVPTKKAVNKKVSHSTVKLSHYFTPFCKFLAW